MMTTRRIDVSTELGKPRVFRRSRGKLQSGLEPLVFEYEPHTETPADDREHENGELYSDGLEDIQRAEADLARVARRASQAIAKGIDTYDRERSRSAHEKEDGAIEDFPHNSAKAMSEAFKEASELPLDIAEAVAPRHARKRMRRNLKQLSKTLRVFRL
jgi:hypothetical protein